MKFEENIPFKLASFGRTEIYALRMDRFKTCSVMVFFIDALSSEKAAKNAMIPAVLRRGCNSHPDSMSISKKLEGLFGSSFDCGVAKKGENHVVYFYIDTLADAFLPAKRSIFGEAANLLSDMICDPVTKDECFLDEYIETEKNNLGRLINSRINDKLQYSLERCFESMCTGEPFGVYEYGSADDFKVIDKCGLFKHYRQFVAQNRMIIFLTGRITEYEADHIVEVVSDMHKKTGRLMTGENSRSANVPLKKETADPKIVTENMDLQQVRLCLGFRTDITPADSLYHPLVVCSSIFGGGVHSKLFRHVREESGLAYYIFARMEKFKGLMVVASGISHEAREAVKELILEQLHELSEGKVSDDELNKAVSSLETSMGSLYDNQMQLADFYLGQLLSGADETLDSTLEKVRSVKICDVRKAASNIRLDTIYTLAGEAAM